MYILECYLYTGLSFLRNIKDSDVSLAHVQQVLTDLESTQLNQKKCTFFIILVFPEVPS